MSTMNYNVKRIDIKEFHEFGFLQEANRQFFHPLGLALEVIVDTETGEESLGGIWDARDDPEGYLVPVGDFGRVGSEKALRVQKLRSAKASVRLERHGYVIQPVS